MVVVIIPSHPGALHPIGKTGGEIGVRLSQHVNLPVDVFNFLIPTSAGSITPPEMRVPTQFVSTLPQGFQEWPIHARDCRVLPKQIAYLFVGAEKPGEYRLASALIPHFLQRALQQRNTLRQTSPRQSPRGHLIEQIFPIRVGVTADDYVNVGQTAPLPEVIEIRVKEVDANFSLDSRSHHNRVRLDHIQSGGSEKLRIDD